LTTVNVVVTMQPLASAYNSACGRPRKRLGRMTSGTPPRPDVSPLAYDDRRPSAPVWLGL